MIWLYVFGALVVIFGFVVAFGAPYLPSHRKDVRRVFDHLKIGKNDVLIDAGSGDGIILREAARRGARAIGYEINPILVWISRLASLRSPLVEVKLANFWLIDIPNETTIVYIFSVGRDRKRLAAKIQAEANRLGRPVKLLCYANPFKDRRPDQTFEAYSLYRFRPLQPQKAQV